MKGDSGSRIHFLYELHLGTGFLSEHAQWVNYGPTPSLSQVTLEGPKQVF